MGIANVIPGVSSGTLAITLNIYEDLIEAISNFFDKIKKNLKLLIPVGIGMILAIILGSRVVEVALEKVTLPTILFFAGLILGGIPMLFNKIKKTKKISYYLIFAITFITVISINFLGSVEVANFTNMQIFDYVKLFLVGILAAGTMIIPGISGSFILIVVGYYEPIINVINEFTSFQNLTDNFLILMPFGLGVLIGIVIIAKIIEWLFNKYEIPTYFAIIGFVLASLISIFTKFNNIVINFPMVAGGIIFFIIGFIAAYKLGEK